MIIFVNTKKIPEEMDFKYAPMFQLGEDTTRYYKLTGEGVSLGQFAGHPILKVTPEALTALSNAAFRDVNFLLRPAHNEQVARILSIVSGERLYFPSSFSRRI